MTSFAFRIEKSFRKVSDFGSKKDERGRALHVGPFLYCHYFTLFATTAQSLAKAPNAFSPGHNVWFLEHKEECRKAWRFGDNTLHYLKYESRRFKSCT